MKNVLQKIIKSGVITWIILIVIWGVVSLFYTETFFPSPIETFKGFKEILLNGKLGEDFKVSMTRVIIGWIRALVIGIPIGLLIGRFKLFSWFIEPVINFFRFVPAIGFLTLFLMWFGVGEESKLVLITYASLFPIVINTIAGVNTIDPIKYHAAESLGANAIQSFFTITIPSVVPSILTGARLGLSSAIISIVGAEMLAANSGLGYLIYTSRLYYRTDYIFVGIVTLGILGFLADRLLRLFAQKSLRRYGV